MEDTLKIEIDRLLTENVNIFNNEELIFRIASDPEARRYLKEHAAKLDLEIEKQLIDEQRISYTRDLLNEYGDFLPASAFAADDGNNLCDLECESHILESYGIKYDHNELSQESRRNYWLRYEGTPLFNIGKLLEMNGLFVSRVFNADLQSLTEALSTCKVITVVNGDILLNKPIDIMADDFNADNCPNHAVVVESIDIDSGTATLFNPASENKKCIYPLELFLDAWSESKHYMLTVRPRKHEFEYCPQPIDTRNVVLNDDLKELVEFLSENAHDVWALTKFKKGYTYGPDDKQHNHFLKPYFMLTEEQKDQDRDNVIATIKLLKRLGYRILNINKMHRCHNCGEAIEPSYNFCPSCGTPLSWKDFK